MQISIKGQRVVGIRTTYDPKKGRGSGSQVISFRSWLASIDEIRASDEAVSAQLDELRDDERSQLEQWLTERSAERSRLSNKSATSSLERQLDFALTALNTEAGQEGLTPEIAQRLYRKSRELQQVMKKLGHSRPKVEG